MIPFIFLYCVNLACFIDPCPAITEPPIPQQIVEFIEGKFNPVWYGEEACSQFRWLYYPESDNGLAAYAK
jgi:hypothetical protein